MDNKQRVPKKYAPIMYLLGTLLFLEWIYPTKQIANTTSLFIFVLYTLFCVVVTLSAVPSWFGNILKGAGLILIVHYLFFRTLLLSRKWFSVFFNDLHENLSLLVQWQLIDLSPMFRTILFLILIWLMTYLIHYWFVVARKFLLFIILTILYLSIIDTFTVYDGSMAMVRTFIYSFIALGFANYFKQTVGKPLSVSENKRYVAWKIPLVLIVIMASVIGYAAPKFSAQWPDPVPFIKSLSGHERFNSDAQGDKQIGLSEDDSRLGGSFIDSESVVFEALATDASYWRVDTKDFYTGKGWIDAESRTTYQAVDGEVSLNIFDLDIERTAGMATVKFKENSFFEKLPYSYETVILYTGNDEEDTTSNFSYDSSGAITPSEMVEGEFNEYGMIYAEPTLDIEELRKIDIAQSYKGNMSEQDFTKYTQLPANLPDRIIELARDITEEYETDYDKVKAVENYFNSNGFYYETKDVPYPAEDEDYVDQFLFETKYGYCDNFSTAMVVLLRTLRIPTRWAKGYTAGEVIERNIDISEEANHLNVFITPPSLNKYEVKNTNAHSWVEVYFPEVGWISFEPTQGFSNLAEFIETDYSDEDVLEVDEDGFDEELDNEDQEFLEPEIDTNENDEQTGVVTKNERKTPYSLMIIVAILAVVAYLFRIRIQTLYYKYRLKNHASQKSYEQAYLYLLKQLARRNYGKKPNETLREYAEKIDHIYNTDQMGDLTSLYEQLLYRESQNINTYQMSQLWENMIRRVIA